MSGRRKDPLKQFAEDFQAGKAGTDFSWLANEQHDSDCSVHNAPAYSAGPCDCAQQYASKVLALNQVWAALLEFEKNRLSTEAEAAIRQARQDIADFVEQNYGVLTVAQIVERIRALKEKA